MSKILGLVNLGSQIEQGTGLILGKDFNLVQVKNRKRNPKNKEKFLIPDPENWAYLRFFETKEVSSKELNKRIIISFLENKKIGFKKAGNTYFVPIKESTLINGAFEGKKIQENEDPKICKLRFEELKKLHKKLPIYGVPNRDQKDFFRGIVYFNYFSIEETEKALSIFLNAGLVVEKRREKECNLTFLLPAEPFDESKFEFGKGHPNGRIFDIFNWIIKKIYRKIITNTTSQVVPGISGRDTINVGEPEIFQIKKSLEEDFGIIIILRSTFRKHSEFYLLLSEEAKTVYHRFKGNITPCDLITILKDPGKEETIRNKSYKNKKKMKKLSNVSEALAKEGLRLRNDGKSPYIQIRILNTNSTKVSLIGGSEKDKREMMEKIKRTISSCYPKASLSMAKSGTSLTVSGTEIENKLRKKRTRNITFSEKPPVEDRHDDIAHAELELRAIIENPILRDILDKKTLAQAEEYLRKQDTNVRVKHLLKILNG